MSRFPKIDQPCPLGIDEQRRIGGYCSRCEKSVHDLTALDDEERVAFMRSVVGPLCVSYRVPRPVPSRHVGASLGAVLAVSVLAAHPMMAADLPLPVVAGFDKSAQSGVEQTSAFQTAATPAAAKCRDGEGEVDSAMSEMTITLGGVNDPMQAVFVDDSELPDLPIVREDAAAWPVQPEHANASVKGSR